MDVTYPKITIDTNNPDPTNAINAFLWCLAKARSIGLVTPAEHDLAEALFRKKAGIVFYSNMSGVLSLIMDEKALADFNDDDDDVMDFIIASIKRRNARRKESAIEARRAETRSGSVEDESAVSEAETPTPGNQEHA